MKKFLIGLLATLSLGAVAFGSVGCSKITGLFQPSKSESEAQESSDSVSENVTSDEVVSENESVNDQTSSSEEESSSESVWVDHGDLVDYFYNEDGKAALTANMDMEIDTPYSLEDVEIGAPGVEEISIDGLGRYTLTVTGHGGGVIRAPEDGKLVFKNMTIENTSGEFDDSTLGFRSGYADFGGKIRFENCKITAPIQIHGEAEIEFVGCSFISELADMYAIWMTQGSATFTDCSFTGYRAIKLYEGSDHYSTLQEAYDIKSVIVEGCAFTNISQKPGLAIDLMTEGETTVVIKDSTFTGCQDFKTGVAEGVDGVYESRTYLDSVDLTIENIEIDGIFYETVTPERAY